MLTELAESTGGRHFPVENLNELPDVAAKIGIELRNQYVLGYTPTNTTKDGKYRRVKVKLKQPRGLPPLKAFYGLDTMPLLSKSPPLTCWRLLTGLIVRAQKGSDTTSTPTLDWWCCTPA